ncbi:hypothetical protein H0H93_002427 [Arthromyces matolae]|nr:hypothetical protein H0H93_002427 [Arthromyces matolae]
MARKTKSTRTTANTVDQVQFPPVAPKEGLQCRVLLDDQILLVDGLFSPEECKAFVKFIEDLPLELTPPKKRGEAERVNCMLFQVIFRSCTRPLMIIWI